MHDGLVHVDHAVAALLVVAEVVAAEVEEAGIGNGLLRRALAGSSAASAMKGLKVEPGG
jgi:hypothetical protein